jgi:predicted naringenin-chalcone synthase
MSVITSIASAVPVYKYQQAELLGFMKNLYEMDEEGKRKLQYLYDRSGIKSRYSVIEDYGLPVDQREFFPKTRNLEPFPNLEKRMELFLKEAPQLGVKAINKCLDGKADPKELTHLITVSCTGMAAPGLDIQLVQELNLNPEIHRTSVNFMGCYAAVHGLKQADYICRSDENAKVLVVCVELCTLHFQKDHDMDNITSNLLFGDGAAAVLVVGNKVASKGIKIDGFHSYIELQGKSDMAWHLSSKGFLMTLSSYIPTLIERGFKALVNKSLNRYQLTEDDIAHWAIHPGGRKILEVIQKDLKIDPSKISSSFKILSDYGNMSSPTILFVLNDILQNGAKSGDKIFGAAFGPGLTMETMVLEVKS